MTRLQRAVTNDGVELPVIDVTNPAFALAPTEVELEAMSTQYILASTQMNQMPAVRQALQTSTFGKATTAASGMFLPGLITYLLKLGPENLTHSQVQSTGRSLRHSPRSRPGFASRT